MKKIVCFIIVLAVVLAVVSACDQSDSKRRVVLSETESAMLSWLGDFASEPCPCTEETMYDAYRNTTTGGGYFCDGVGWQLIAQDGVDGVDGTNGIGIVWLGTFTTAPESPEYNNAYHNITDGNSYIYTGSSWVVMVQNASVRVYDAADTFLGYHVSDNLVLSPLNYLLNIETLLLYTVPFSATVSTVTRHDILFLEPDCAGQAYIRTYEAYLHYNVVQYTAITDTFYVVNTTDVADLTYPATTLSEIREYNNNINLCRNATRSNNQLSVLQTIDPATCGGKKPSEITLPLRRSL